MVVTHKTVMIGYDQLSFFSTDFYGHPEGPFFSKRPSIVEEYERHYKTYATQEKAWT